MATVSVIIPTYNRAHYLRATLTSVLAQTYRDFEIIVIDDGSTDDTETVVAACADPRLTYLRQPHRGLPASRNTGLQVATGTYVAFLDSDDLFFPHRLALHVAALEAKPELAWVYSDAEYFRDDGTMIGTFLQDRRPPPQGWVFGQLLLDNFMVVCSVTLRRSCLAQAGPFDKTPGIIEDHDLWLRMAERYPIAFVEGVVSGVRVHEHRLSGGTRVHMYLGTLQILDKVAAASPERVRPYQALLRERRSLLHLAAARVYFQTRDLPQAGAHLAASIAANPSPRWLAYLLSRPHPARQWLVRRAGQIAEGERHSG